MRKSTPSENLKLITDIELKMQTCNEKYRLKESLAVNTELRMRMCNEIKYRTPKQYQRVIGIPLEGGICLGTSSKHI